MSMFHNMAEAVFDDVEPEISTLQDLGVLEIPNVLSISERAYLMASMIRNPGRLTEPWSPETSKREPNEFVKSHTHFGTLQAHAIASNRIVEKYNRNLDLVLHPELHFLTYREGDYIDCHKDDGMDSRPIVFSLVLNKEFEGGQFVIYSDGYEYEIDVLPGTMIIFPGHLAHAVKEVTVGVRYSITGWFTDEIQGKSN